MADEDWLNEPAPDYPVAKPDEGKPADDGSPGLPISLSEIDRAASAQEKRRQFIAAWDALTTDQKVFLNTWRESRFSYSRTRRVLEGTAIAASKTTLGRWRESLGFVLVEHMLRSASVEEILSRDAIVTRFEDIAETALTPQHILHQGVATGHFEVELGAATKANEMLAKLGGHLRDDTTNVNVAVGFIPTPVEIEVAADATVVEQKAIEASVELPADEESWLS